MSIGSRIKERRLALDLTQEELAKCLNVSKGAIANYENEVSTPKPDILFNVISALKCDANYLFQDMVDLKDDTMLNPNEYKFITKYRQLDEYGLKAVSAITDIELERMNCIGSSRHIYSRRVMHYNTPYYALPVSAGTGEFLDSEHYTIAELANEPPIGTNFIVRVSGDSMEPTYHDGDKLFIKQQHSVEIGEIGIFMIDGNIYVKELAEDGLISHNKTYNKIPFHEYNNIRCYGKVLGICTEEI